MDLHMIKDRIGQYAACEDSLKARLALAGSKQERLELERALHTNRTAAESFLRLAGSDFGDVWLEQSATEAVVERLAA